MKYWPVPDSYSKNIPLNGPGSFAEDRGDRHHSGVDIYASKGSVVVSIEDGIVVAEDIFTTPGKNPYWFMTRFVAIKNGSGQICKYCELEDVSVKRGDKVKGGQVIGHVGSVLDFNNIDQGSPLYIQKMKESGVKSMLHFELYAKGPVVFENYCGGNCFSSGLPDNLLDPTEYLLSIAKSNA
ncbi:MAG: M23 family metallopeptidase [Candidatus Omnitrophica bacterium]|nr:M23 family metallopeptidase [Candidatus Omnitrophota bacterium]